MSVQIHSFEGTLAQWLLDSLALYVEEDSLYRDRVNFVSNSVFAGRLLIFSRGGGGWCTWVGALLVSVVHRVPLSSCIIVRILCHLRASV